MRPVPDDGIADALDDELAELAERATPADSIPSSAASPPLAPPTWPRGARTFFAWTLSIAVCAGSFALHAAPLPPFSISAGDGVRHPIGAAIIAILVGMAIRNLIPLPRGLGSRLRQVVRITIPAAVVLGAAELDLRTVAGLSLPALTTTIACVLVGLGAAVAASRALGLNRATALMLGAGTAICGNSAVVAVAPLVRAEDDDVGVAIGTVNLAGLAVMLALPPLGHLLGLSPSGFGVWAGTTIHSVPQVAAAGEAFSRDAAAIATLVKLVRVAMLAPLVFVIAILEARRREAQVLRSAAQPGAADTAPLWSPASIVRYGRYVPWFVWGFIAVAAINTLGLMPTMALPWSDGPVALGPVLSKLSAYLLAIAMAAIGLELDLRTLMRVGLPALAAGFIAAIVLVAVSLGMTVAFVS